MENNLESLEKMFLERIDRGEKIEPQDWMPDGYRHALQRQMSQHAHSEYVGMLPEGAWIRRAPSLSRKCILLAKVQDEAGHAQYLYSALESLKQSRDHVYGKLLSGEAKYLNIFNYPALTWADVGMIGWLTDGAAIVNQVPLSRSSYGPYARAMVRICQEESFHNRQGFDLIRRLVEGTPEQRQMAQEALNRWWWPTVMVFGPPDEHSIHSRNAMRWGIKLYSNDTLRQKFIDQTVPQVMYLGLEVPDPDLRFNSETGHYEIGAINWDEFHRVIQGNGLCNHERINSRRRAWEENAWVREAVACYATKHAKK
ncbi:1,2-phenylacetyl-CoA epoxidase subunit A [Xenorhabdus nematophila]|uniref:1,2-phenylacetyl-CoA epoxidase subunit PaaA n=1 Tax=Xenorhabdus nematophila TaxID=628 RepID=UPI0003275DE5|nr:1,2-phenylacetyl-CoA epoxidase subunit PaaA [Xenorhabdus nematophila]CEF29455.1 putative multicomponent oxygenase/reductase subunit for phenylacetic acid degradation [Xenorhabdus nematophila str. Websteri]KHD27590.1 ATPase AAA [Xenorhabdus nematophila]MBA0018824.1 1,2-phenylacetyl-CoA epoxidase subunit A [Xenorhabdus nematophila]MCB4426533.1 1,2-phenylacetyl-CoA epoxidase subunit A [Xenorhabdus nematophila]CCW28987.1 Phenylacetic acid degradation protein paaA [Xenorhabdus nematophila F1]